MPRLRRNPVTVSRGPGRRIGSPARGKNDGIGGQPVSVREKYPAHPAVRKEQRLHPRAKTDFHILLPQNFLQSGDDVRRVVRHGKPSLPALRLHRHAVFLKKADHALVVTGPESTVQKLRIAHDTGKKILRSSRVRQVTAPFSGEIELFPELFIFFQQYYIMSAFRRRYRGKHSGRPAAGHNHFTHSGPYLLFWHSAF